MPHAPSTLFDKLWDSHVIAVREDGEALLWVDRHLVHEGSHHAFRKLDERGMKVAEPQLTFGVADHYVPTQGQPRVPEASVAGMIDRLSVNAAAHGIRHFGMEAPEQGIVHVVGPERGITLPGLLVVCGDSHTSTHGALGAFAFGIGASEVAHVLMTQSLWQKKPKCMRITVDGALGPHVTAKDLALHVIATIGADGARGHALEYAGSVIESMSIEGRLTLCNMAIEAGARCAVIAPDDATFGYVAGRPGAPKGQAFDAAVAYWRTLKTDTDATFDRDCVIIGRDVTPMVTWGVSPEDALPVSARVPVGSHADAARAAYLAEAQTYMGLTPGMAITDISVDRVFIGSCTNGRLDDLRAAANVLRGRTAKVPGLVSPGSTAVKRAAEAEGLDRVFIDAGLTWGASGCSMCVGMNGDLVKAGERCASSTNRNFRGRQGVGARTHLMSPAMVAAAAVTGYLTDVRDLPQLEAHRRG
jgi:3-isopropylmalate/(R)-2-methylmalate dehydratase large subunit